VGDTECVAERDVKGDEEREVETDSERESLGDFETEGVSVGITFEREGEGEFVGSMKLGDAPDIGELVFWRKL